MKKMIAALAALLISVSSFAAETENESPEHKNIGVYAGTLGDTTLSLVSINFAYEPTPDFRISAGTGITLGYTLGIGVKYLFARSWPVRPFVGANGSVVYSNFVSNFGSALSEMFGTTPSGTVWEWYGFFGPTLGVDWKHKSGFNLALGGNLWVSSGTPTVVPFVNVGWFF